MRWDKRDRRIAKIAIGGAAAAGSAIGGIRYDAAVEQFCGGCAAHRSFQRCG